MTTDSIVTGKLDAIEVAKVTGDIPQSVNFSLKISTLNIFLSTNRLPEVRSEIGAAISMEEVADLLFQSTAKVICMP